MGTGDRRLDRRTVAVLAIAAAWSVGVGLIALTVRVAQSPVVVSRPNGVTYSLQQPSETIVQHNGWWPLTIFSFTLVAIGVVAVACDCVAQPSVAQDRSPWLHSSCSPLRRCSRSSPSGSS